MAEAAATNLSWVRVGLKQVLLLSQEAGSS